MKGKFLNNAANKYNSAYGKMKTGGTTKMKMGGTTKLKKYQGDRSEVTTMSGPVNPMQAMSTASSGPRGAMSTSTMDTGKRTPRSSKVMKRAIKNWTKAEEYRKNPGTYGEYVANRLYGKATRLGNRAKKLKAKGK